MRHLLPLTLLATACSPFEHPGVVRDVRVLRCAAPAIAGMPSDWVGRAPRKPRREPERPPETTRVVSPARPSSNCTPTSTTP